LVITFPVKTIERLAAQISTGEFQIDLNRNEFKTPDGETLTFAIDSWRRESLLKGLDSLDYSLTFRDKIKEFQRVDKVMRPWVYRIPVSK